MRFINLRSINYFEYCKLTYIEIIISFSSQNRIIIILTVVIIYSALCARLQAEDFGDSFSRHNNPLKSTLLLLLFLVEKVEVERSYHLPGITEKVSEGIKSIPRTVRL